jgi:hypothetical protein
LKIVVSLFITCLVIFCGSLFYSSYQNYINPAKVYGTWSEMGVPDNQREILVLNEHGVFRNNHLVSTEFEFDGSRVYITTGSGVTIYEMSGTTKEPQLKRVSPPDLPIQEFAHPDAIKTDALPVITPPRQPMSLGGA